MQPRFSVRKLLWITTLVAVCSMGFASLLHFVGWDDPGVSIMVVYVILVAMLWVGYAGLKDL